MKTAVIGTGNMGTALAWLLARNGHTVTCWDHVPEVVEDVRANRRNERYLPGVQLPETVTADPLLHHAVTGAELVAVAVPSAFLRQVVKEFTPFALPTAVVVGASKGLELGSGKRPSEVYAEASAHSGTYYVALAGPCVADDFARGRLTRVVCASRGRHESTVRAALENPVFQVTWSDDLAGVEWGSVLKNVYALGLGLLAGTPEGSPNGQGAFVAAALAEMKALGCRFGAREETLEGLAGLGDLVATGFSPRSHHRRLGEFLATGCDFEEAVDRLGGGVPEGVRTAALLAERVRREGLSAPLLNLVHACLQNPGWGRTFAVESWKALQGG